MPRTFERCWVIGAGAIGSVLAAVMYMEKKAAVRLVGQSPHARTVREKGLFFQVEGGADQLLSIPTVLPQEVPRLTDKDLVLLTQKVPGLEAAAAWLGPKCTQETGIIALQNGIGSEEIAAKALGRPVDRGLAFFGGNSPALGHVRYFPGRIRLRQSSVTEAFAALMEGSPLPCEVSGDFKKTEWQKLAINCIANPLAGILGVNNSRIVRETLNPAKEAILSEVRQVALAEGVVISTTVQDINRRLNQENTPSLRADLERKYQTEVDVLNGAVVRYAEKHGIPTPVNSLLVSLVKFLESR